MGQIVFYPQNLADWQAVGSNGKLVLQDGLFPEVATETLFLKVRTAYLQTLGDSNCN